MSNPLSTTQSEVCERNAHDNARTCDRRGQPAERPMTCGGAPCASGMTGGAVDAR